MSTAKIAFINRSSVIHDVDARRVMEALGIQAHRDFAPIWGKDAELVFVPKDQQPPGGLWWLTILDYSDQAEDLGYHDMTDEGLPIGKIFARTDMIAHQSWTATASHELLEMLADPDTNQTASVHTDASHIRLYAMEVCDPCEDDSLGYHIRISDSSEILVSDFVYPTWFQSFHAPHSTQFDFMSKIGRPFQLLPGGYISVYDVGSALGWRQISPRMQEAGPEPNELGYMDAAQTDLPYRARPRLGSRRERRRTPRWQWLPSKVRTDQDSDPVNLSVI